MERSLEQQREDEKESDWEARPNPPPLLLLSVHPTHSWNCEAPWRGSEEDVPHGQGGEEGTAFPPQGPGATFHQPNSPHPHPTPPNPTQPHPVHQTQPGGDALGKGRDDFSSSPLAPCQGREGRLVSD
ncbi:hypothetical protein EYF80_007895 [Liparis tanakae]|uniref:Uncharacterized protein n=1 Tax=Liparis tanakae TaxID=230148 RepID=A0A4Z2IV71_9TELE|nr:hypothetical protein EYF80_007895 [Liparis tanakae]